LLVVADSLVITLNEAATIDSAWPVVQGRYLPAVGSVRF
jgi:hypothetical protein